jgi:hypothetical protein
VKEAVLHLGRRASELVDDRMLVADAAQDVVDARVLRVPVAP